MTLVNPSARLFDDDQDYRSYQFFWAKTMPTMRGHYYHDFWLDLIPHASQEHVAIRYALAALGSLQRSWGETGAHLTQTTETSLRQYNKAIGYLLQQQMPLVASLVVSILFAQFHLAQGQNYHAGVGHLRSGLRIIAGIRNPSMRDAFVLQRYVLPVFKNFASGMLNELLTEHPSHLEWLSETKTLSEPGGLAPFTSLQQARNHLQAAMDDIFTEIEMKACAEEFTRLADSIDRGKEFLCSWYRHLLTYLNCIARSKDEGFVRDAYLLRLQYHVCLITLSTVARDNEMRYDPHWNSFREIVQLCAGILETESEAKMTFETGLIPALDFVAQKCRERSVRRQAITLIDRYSAEGVLRSHAAITVWHLIMWVEEKGNFGRDSSLHTVSLENRIKATRIVFHPGYRAEDRSALPDCCLVDGPWELIHPHWHLFWEPADPARKGEECSACFPLSLALNASPTGKGTLGAQAFGYKQGFLARRHEMRMALTSQSPAHGLSQPWTSGAELRLIPLLR